MGVGDAVAFGAEKEFAAGGFEGLEFDALFHLHHLANLGEEPRVDRCHFVDLVDSVAAGEGEADVVETIGRRGDQLLGDEVLVKGFGAEGFAGLETENALPQRLFKGAADGHDFADRLHLGAERVVCARKFLELPFGDLGDHVINGRLEARGRDLGDVVADLVEAIADGQLCGNLGNGEAGGFGGQRGRSRDARIHLDDDHAAGLGMNGELDVGAAGIDADFAQAADGTVAHHLVFLIGQGLRRSDGDGVAGVHTHGIEVLDGTDDDNVVGKVAHHLQLEFLPAERAFFGEHFVDRREIEAAFQDGDQVFAIVGDAAAGAAQSKAGTQDHREADLRREGEAAFDIGDELGRRGFEADLPHGVLEEQTVFGFLDGVDFCADELDAVSVEHAGFGEFDREIQAGLTAHGGEQRVGAFDADDLFDVLAAERFDVGFVGEIGVGHDGRGVGVDQDDFEAVGFEGLGGLGAGVVEFAGLADDDGAGAYDEDSVEVGAAGH